MGKEIPLEVHHVDGDRLNNELTNLQLLCPNCHAQTDNYCGRKDAARKRISDEQLAEALKSTTSIRKALMMLGVNYDAKSWYARARAVIEKYGIIQKLPEQVHEDKDKNINKPRKCCVRCGGPVSHNAKTCMCRKCYEETYAKDGITYPSKEELEKDIHSLPFLQIGKKYGVSDNAVRKWCRKYNLPATRKELTENYG